MIECPNCESTEMAKTQYKEDGYVVEISFTCKSCGQFVGTDSYGSGFEYADE